MPCFFLVCVCCGQATSSRSNSCRKTSGACSSREHEARQRDEQTTEERSKTHARLNDDHRDNTTTPQRKRTPRNARTLSDDSGRTRPEQEKSAPARVAQAAKRKDTRHGRKKERYGTRARQARDRTRGATSQRGPGRGNGRAKLSTGSVLVVRHATKKPGGATSQQPRSCQKTPQRRTRNRRKANQSRRHRPKVGGKTDQKLNQHEKTHTGSEPNWDSDRPTTRKRRRTHRSTR